MYFNAVMDCILGSWDGLYFWMCRWRYLVHRKALLRVTDLVLDKLRVADSTVATIERNIVQGLSKGRTEIQVGGSGHP